MMGDIPGLSVAGTVPSVEAVGVEVHVVSPFVRIDVNIILSQERVFGNGNQKEYIKMTRTLS